jgi:hydroxyacylglutathione hydrolase
VSTGPPEREGQTKELILGLTKDAGELTELTKNVHKVDGVNANSYFVIEPEGSLTLIDSGTGADGGKILAYASSIGKKPADIKTIVLTHWHVDHVRGAAAIKAATKGNVAIHELDADILSGKAKAPGPKGGMGVLFALLSVFFKSKPVVPDVLLKDGDKLGGLTVIHTPGHTAGSISLLYPEGKAIFVGDAIISSDGGVKGPPKQFTQDMKQARESIGIIAKQDFRLMLSGHGKPIDSQDAPKMVARYLTDLD